MLGNEQERLSRLEKKWPNLQARAEKGRRVWRIVPLAYAGYAIVVLLIWNYPFLRAAVLALMALTAPAILHYAYWIDPFARAPYRLPFEEYRRRLALLRQVPRRPLEVRALSMTVSLAAIAAALLATIAFLLGPYTVAHLVETVLPLIGIASLLMAASNLLVMRVYEKVDEILTGMPLARRLRVIALGYAGAGFVCVGISLVYRLGLAAYP